MQVQGFVETAYAIGGAWGVATLLLTAAVVYLYRAREKEHRERLREARENAKLMAKLLETASKRSLPPRPAQSSSVPLIDEEWDEESTVLTRVRQQQVREMVIRYIEDD